MNVPDAAHDEVVVTGVVEAPVTDVETSRGRWVRWWIGPPVHDRDDHCGSSGQASGDRYANSIWGVTGLRMVPPTTRRDRPTFSAYGSGPVVGDDRAQCVTNSCVHPRSPPGLPHAGAEGVTTTGPDKGETDGNVDG